ncbi:MAG: creatininase family protein [Armatimonadetes bacterium]|nr:creatininase family protein [Armatimonadota bacterium]
MTDREQKKNLWWQYMTWDQVVDHAKECDIAILPMGSIEQHGHHLPTGHDTIQLFPMLEEVAERTGAILLASPWYGAHPVHHHHFPGTIPLSSDTCRFLIKDIIRGASEAGYNKFIIFFGHGQAWVANYCVQELGLEGYFVLSVMFQNMMRDLHNEIFETPFWHADEAETSVGLVTHPDLVDMSKAIDESATRILDGQFVQSPSDYAVSKPLRFDEGTLSVPEYKDLQAGVIGRPTLATREKGERYVQTIIDRMSDLVNEIKTKYPAGTKVPIK